MDFRQQWLIFVFRPRGLVYSRRFENCSFVGIVLDSIPARNNSSLAYLSVFNFLSNVYSRFVYEWNGVGPKWKCSRPKKSHRYTIVSDCSPPHTNQKHPSYPAVSYKLPKIKHSELVKAFLFQLLYYINILTSIVVLSAKNYRRSKMFTC